MPERVVPAARATLYDPGAEGFAIDQGFFVFDRPAQRLQRREDEFGKSVKSWLYETSQRSAGGGYSMPNVESFQEIVTVAPRGFIIFKDTPTSNWTFFGGQFENKYVLSPDYSGARTARLFQRSAAKNTVWRALSNFTVHENPNIAFSVARLQAKHDNDQFNYPAKVQVTICDTWAIRFSDGEDSGIWEKKGGVWYQVLQHGLGDKGKEYHVMFCVRNGCVCISFNGGQKWWIARDELPFEVGFGQIEWAGVSCQAIFGFHQLFFETCWYETFDLPTLEQHLGTPNRDLTYTIRPFQTNISLQFLPSAAGSIRYRVTMTPIARLVTGLAWSMYDVPEVQAIGVYWNPVLHAPVGGYVDLVSLGVVDQIDIHEEQEISQRTGSINVMWSPVTAFVGNYGYRMIDIDLGYLYDDDSFIYVDRAVMYIAEPSVEADENFSPDITLGLVDMWVRAETTTVDEGWMPLDGFSTIDARNYILAKMGLPPWRAAWLATGAVLPSGMPIKPRWWPKPGMKASELFEALDFFENTETFVGPSGVWTNRVARYVDVAVSYIWDGLGADPTRNIRRINFRARHEKVRTAVIVTDEDDRGGSFWATSINYNLERVPGWPGFVGWRIWDRKDNLGLVTLEEAMMVANYIRNNQDDVPYLPEVTVPMEPTMFRGSRVRIINSEMVGSNNLAHFCVDAIEITVRPTKHETAMTFIGRRL